MSGFGRLNLEMAHTLERPEASQPASFTTFGTAPVRLVSVADNKPFIDRVNTGDLIGILKRPTKTVVVTQTPPAGEQVPLGTQITLTLAVKDTLPLGPLGVDPLLVGKFATAGALQDAVEAAPQAEALKEVLGAKASYQDLAGSQKEAADAFLGQLGVADQDRGTALGDLGFVFNL
jgi:hypothetical protein